MAVSFYRRALFGTHMRARSYRTSFLRSSFKKTSISYTKVDISNLIIGTTNCVRLRYLDGHSSLEFSLHRSNELFVYVYRN